MNVSAVRKVLETMRANIQMYGFSPDWNKDLRDGACFVRSAVGCGEVEFYEVKDYLRGFIPLNPVLELPTVRYCTECLSHLNTDSALSIIDVALLSLPQEQSVETEQVA